jgi:hypothetical protein
LAGICGRSGPPRNQNAFRHGLAGIAQHRSDGVLSPPGIINPRRNPVL